MTIPQNVRQKILDTAESLFADNGYHGVSVRDITTAAGVRVASINDIFGGKEQLFEAVIDRRAGTINADRLSLLEHLPSSANKRVQLKRIVDAFSKPLLDRSHESAGWRNYLRLVSQLSNSRSAVLMTIAGHFNPIAVRFIEAIGEVLPALDARQRLVAYQLMVSSVMAVFADNYRINILSGNAYWSSDFDKHYNDLVHFVAGGMLAMASDG